MNNQKITFLGTGAPDATKYAHTSFFIKWNGYDKGMLVDTGGGSNILTNLERVNIALEDIKYIFISHKHIDHIFGIFWILRFLGSSINKGKAENLTIFCSKKTEGIIKTVSLIFLKEKVTNLFDSKIIFNIIDNQQTIELNDSNLKFIDLKSSKEEQYGFNLTFDDSTNLVYLGDEPYKDELATEIKNTDYLIHNAFCLERDRDVFNPHNMNHSTVKEGARNASAIGAKNLILFHTEDEKTFGQRKSLYTEEAKNFFSGNIFVPEDLETIVL